MSNQSLSEPDNGREASVDRVGRYQIVHKIGTVQDVQARSHHSTFSSGGGGMLHNGTGYIAAPTTSSVSKSWQRVFAVNDQGREWQFEVEDGFAVRRGNRVNASYVTKGKGAPILAAVRNLDTNEGWRWPMKSILPGYSTAVLLWAAIAVVWSLYTLIGVADNSAPTVLANFLQEGPLIPLLLLVLAFRWWQRRSTRQKLWEAMGHS